MISLYDYAHLREKTAQNKNASAFLPRRARRVSAFHCARLRSAGGFILHREIVLTMKASFTLRAYLMSEDTRKSAMKNKKVSTPA